MKFMAELILKGYAREPTSAVVARKCCYLPHHEVYHPNKPGIHGIGVAIDMREDMEHQQARLCCQDLI